MSCSECDVYWYGEELPKCSERQHQHQRFEIHRHRSVVIFPDRTEVTAVSFDQSDPYTRESVPDYGLYLDDRWQPPWGHDHLDWPDFGVPVNAPQAIFMMKSAFNRARGGLRIELGCIGGHGRTGTALACMAIFSGLSPSDAVEWVRSNYCTQAIEILEQEAFVNELISETNS